MENKRRFMIREKGKIRERGWGEKEKENEKKRSYLQWLKIPDSKEHFLNVPLLSLSPASPINS